MKEYALITGGASGLGKDLSILFAKDGINLFLVSSNKNNLENAKKELNEKYDVDIHILPLDLSDPNNFPKVKEYSDKNSLKIKYLVNCAGFGDRTDFKDMDIVKQIKMVELNCNAPLYLMREYVNDMINDHDGYILNVASTASFFPGPYMCTYHATKSFLLNLSEGIGRELKGTGVSVSTICPGPFESGFVEKAGNYHTFSISKVYPSDVVAQMSYDLMKKRKSLKIIGFKNKSLVFFSKFVSRKMIVDSSAKILKE